MKTRKLILVATLIAITLSTSLSAQAGLMDWFRSNGASSQVAHEGSFDQLYASVLSSGATDDERPMLMANAVVPANSPVGGTKKALRKTYLVEVSAYNSEAAQTDDSPFITAKGTHVRDGIVATNMFPFGTVIKIPSLFGDKIFVVEDRMNTRYQKNVDVWFADKAAALKLGRRLVQIEVIQ
ncbi:MAG: 3D domain-containing protein [Candidatus Yanofskybacteria bacterium]|nr:3D domain-containing protein [Candidatus Yanofskybacteria bacterium]